jgi:putative acetyltransferase
MTIEAAQRVEEMPFIRPATEADLPACAAIINDYVDATDWLPRTRSHEEIAALFSVDLLHSRLVLVAEIGGEIGGYLTLTPEGEVPALYLAPRFRGLGLGKMLIDRVKAEHPSHLELTVFETNEAAKRFYEREGFREIPERRTDDTEEGVATLFMRWRGTA